LFWKGEERPFLIDGIKKTGIIQQVSDEGSYGSMEDTLREFDIKEIILLPNLYKKRIAHFRLSNLVLNLSTA
jgi:GTP cyclohydrolase II